MTNYPASADSFTAPTPLVSFIRAQDIIDLQSAVVAVEGVLGTNPQGGAATVKARIAAIESAGNGWAPLLAVVTDGARRVLQVTDWTGGTGSKPTAGLYVSATGLTATLADAVDLRGAQGVQGATGPAGADGAAGAQGPKGDTGAAGPGPYPAWTSGRNYTNSPGASGGVTTPALSAFYASPIYVASQVSADTLILEVTTAATAGGVVRMGIYDTNANGLPGALVAEAPAVSTTTIGMKIGTFPAPVTLAPGWYWLGAVAQVAAPIWRTIANIQNFPFSTSGAPSAGLVVNGYIAKGPGGTTTEVTGSLYSTFMADGSAAPSTAAGTTIVVPRIYLHTA